MKKVASILIIIFIFPSLLLAKGEYPEKWDQEKWCEKAQGQVKEVLPDVTRCDCMTDKPFTKSSRSQSPNLCSFDIAFSGTYSKLITG
jgi:hypothetical protein